jgi:hypothetical protein
VDQGGKTPVAGVSQRAPPDAGRAPHDLAFLLLNRHGIWHDPNHRERAPCVAAQVKDVVVAGLGSDENGEQIIQLNRLYSIMADSYETYQYVCGAPETSYVPASQLAAPKFNLKLGPFYLSGNGVYDDSNECNWVNNGKGDWNIEFDNTGEDLKALANPACPY